MWDDEGRHQYCPHNHGGWDGPSIIDSIVKLKDRRKGRHCSLGKELKRFQAKENSVRIETCGNVWK